MQKKESRYSRNRIYVENVEQEKIRKTKIILGGAGIGSIIAECMLRLGFENFKIVDGDIVELSNLNRQNYTQEDIGLPKVEALKKRLLQINPEANIETFYEYINNSNLDRIIKDGDLAINALDFTTDIPLKFDQACQKLNIPILHPYNLGWACLVILIKENTGLETLSQSNQNFNELNVVEYLTSYHRFWGNPIIWLEDIINEYKNEKEKLSPPQLSVGSWLAGSLCANIAFDLINHKPVKVFPDFHYLSSKEL